MPTRVRNCIIASSTLVAVLLYLDRTCIMQIAASMEFRSEFSMLDSNEDGPARQGHFMSAFFFTYALGQVPAGWLADRFGARGMMTGFVLLWSACTVLTGLAANFAMLIAARLLFGRDFFVAEGNGFGFAHAQRLKGNCSSGKGC